MHLGRKASPLTDEAIRVGNLAKIRSYRCQHYCNIIQHIIIIMHDCYYTHIASLRMSEAQVLTGHY